MVLEIRIEVTFVGIHGGWEGPSGALWWLLMFCFLIRVVVTEIFSVSQNSLSGILTTQ